MSLALVPKVLDREFAADAERERAVSGHGIDACACGAVISQCRCIGPHGPPRVVCQTCKACQPQKSGAR